MGQGRISIWGARAIGKTCFVCGLYKHGLDRQGDSKSGRWVVAEDCTSQNRVGFDNVHNFLMNVLKTGDLQKIPQTDRTDYKNQISLIFNRCSRIKKDEVVASVCMDFVDFAGEHASDQNYHNLLKSRCIIWCLDPFNRDDGTLLLETMDKIKSEGNSEFCDIPVAFCLTKMDRLTRALNWDSVAIPLFKEAFGDELLTNVVQTFKIHRIFSVSAFGYCIDKNSNTFISNVDEENMKLREIDFRPEGMGELLGWVLSH